MSEKKSLVYAIYLLNRRWRTVFELTKKLESKNYPPEDIKKTLDFLLSNNLLNDERFALSWIRTRLSLRPSGRSLINIELKRKGLSQDIIEKAWQKYSEEQDFSEIDIALDAARHKLRSYQKLPSEIFTRRMMTFLIRRGFSYGIIKETLAIIEKEK